MKKLKLLAVSAVVVGGLPLAVHNAVAAEPGYFYVGAGVGSASFESAEFITDFGNDTFKDSDFAYRIFAGYQVTPALGLEIGWADLGNLKDTAFGVNAEIEPNVFDVVAVGTAPLTDSLSVFGKAGVAFISVDSSATFDGGEGAGSASTDSQDLTIGGGLQFNMGAIGIRGEFQWYDIEDADKSVMYSVSGLWKFGGP